MGNTHYRSALLETREQLTSPAVLAHRRLEAEDGGRGGGRGGRRRVQLLSRDSSTGTVWKHLVVDVRRRGGGEDGLVALLSPALDASIAIVVVDDHDRHEQHGRRRLQMSGAFTGPGGMSMKPDFTDHSPSSGSRLTTNVFDVTTLDAEKNGQRHFFMTLQVGRLF